MSQGPGDRQRFPDFNEPIDAELVEDHVPAQPVTNRPAMGPGPQLPFPPKPQRSSRAMLGLGIVAAVVLLAICSGSIALIYQAGKELASQGTAGMPEDRPLAEQRDTILAKLDGATQDAVNDPKYRDVRRLLRKLEQAKATNNANEFNKLVDWPAHMPRYYKSYRFQPLNFRERNELDAIERDDFEMPAEANDFRIVAIEELTENDWLLYTYAQEGALSNAAYIFQVRFKKDQWKLVDWAEVAEMSWQSQRNGVGAGLQFGDFAGDEQGRLIDELKASDRLREGGDIAGAAAQLRQAEGRNGIPALHDSNYYLIALRWNALGKAEDAQRVLKRVNNPDAFPWVHDLQAQIHYQRGEHAEAIAAAERFERVAGFYFDLMYSKASSQAALKQNEATAKSALSLLHYEPDNYQALTLALRHAPPLQLQEVLSRFTTKPESLQQLTNAARSLLYNDQIENYQLVRDYIAKQDPASKHAASMDAELLHYQGELEQAVALYKQLLEKEQDPDERQSLQQTYLTLLQQLKSPLEIYQESTNPRETLAALVAGDDDEETILGTDDFKKILALHKERDAEDPDLPWYLAQEAAAGTDVQAAIAAIERALKSLPENDESEYRRESLEHQLMEKRVDLGLALDVYRKAEDKREAYREVASLLRNRGDDALLQQLNDLHPEMPDDLWRRYYGLHIREQAALQSGDRQERKQLLTDYQTLRQANQASRTVYEGFLDSTIDELGTSGPDWRAYFETHDNPLQLLYRLRARFEREKNQAALQELILLAKQKFPDEEILHQWTVDDLWEQQDYAGIIAYCEAHPFEKSLNRYYSLAYMRRSHLLLSYLIQGDFEKAKKLVEDSDNDTSKQWLVQLAAGHPDTLREFIKEKGSKLYSPLTFTADMLRVKAIADFVKSEEFRRLRTELPLQLSRSYPDSKAVLFFDKPVDWNADLIRERLQAAGISDVEVEALSKPPITTNTFRLRSPRSSTLLTFASGRYVTDADLRDADNNLSVNFKNALSSHQQWVALDLESRQPPAAEQEWLQLVGALAVDSTAIWGKRSAEYAQAVVTPQNMQQIITSPGTALDFQSPDKNFPYLPWSGHSEDEEPESRWFTRARGVAAGGPPGRVRVVLDYGHAREEQWLEVVGVENQHWGNYAVNAKMTQDSALEPLLRQGDLVRLSFYEIDTWEVPTP